MKIKIVDRIDQLKGLSEYETEIYVCRCTCIKYFTYDGHVYNIGEKYYIEYIGIYVNANNYLVYGDIGNNLIDILDDYYLFQLDLKIGSEDIRDYFKDIPTIREEAINKIIGN